MTRILTHILPLIAVSAGNAHYIIVTLGTVKTHVRQLVQTNRHTHVHACSQFDKLAY